METREVVIVGSGPAGSALALSLARVAPGLVPDILVLERARHPRPKPCGGGVTMTGERVLRRLGLSWQRLGVPNVPVHTLRLQYHTQVFHWHVPYIFRVIRREEFDAALVAAVRAQGVEVREETPVTGAEREGGWWVVTTPHGRVRTRILVGADGARGIVRRVLGLPGTPRRVSRILEVLTPPVDPVGRETFREHLAVFDFSVMKEGIQGYVWDFPSLVSGEPTVNRGIFDNRVWSHKPRRNLRAYLAQAMQARGLRLEEYTLVGHPERWYDPQGKYSAPGAILIGDAAGVEPLLGEGISYALWYGETVAPWIVEALERGDLSFADYERRLRQSPLGRNLTFRLRLARFAYARSHRFVHFWWPSLGRALQLFRRKVLRDMAREGLGQFAEDGEETSLPSPSV